MDNQVEYFETGLLSDCVIRVGCSRMSTFQDYKCHKLILSMESEVFQVMFYGNFKEANMGPDEPILLDNVDPKVFEYVMRCVYGQAIKELQSISFGIEAYKFANEMQIKGLPSELDKIFNSIKANGIFQIFDLYHLISNQNGLASCKTVVEFDTAEALDLEHWLHMSQDSVEEFLRMNYMDVREVHLVSALIRWGKFQVQKDGDNPEDKLKLRNKILPGLKLIRFATMTKKEVPHCLEELDGVLRAEEKHSLDTKDWKADVFASAKADRRKKAHLVCNLPNFVKSNDSGLWNKLDGWGYSTNDCKLKRVIYLRVDKSVELAGLSFKGTTQFDENWREFFAFELWNGRSQLMMGSGFSSRKQICHNGEHFIKFTPKCVLEADARYTLALKFGGPDRSVKY